MTLNPIPLIRSWWIDATGGPRDWKVVAWAGTFLTIRGAPLSVDRLIRDNLTRDAALRLARRLRQQAEDTPEGVG